MFRHSRLCCMTLGTRWQDAGVVGVVVTWRSSSGRSKNSESQVPGSKPEAQLRRAPVLALSATKLWVAWSSSRSPQYPRRLSTPLNLSLPPTTALPIHCLSTSSSSRHGGPILILPHHFLSQVNTALSIAHAMFANVPIAESWSRSVCDSGTIQAPL
jgi:hypothetical protein